jgi:hypothetical protein
MSTPNTQAPDTSHRKRLMPWFVPGFAMTLAILTGGCGKKATVVEVNETRPLTTADQAPKLMATSKQRFQRSGHGATTSHNKATGPARYAGTTPEGWNKITGTSIRLLNYAVGADRTGEVYVSQTRGGLLGNVERWRSQFGIANTVGEDLLEMQRVLLMGAGEGLLVEATGTYSPGMGRPAMPGHAMAGVIGVLQDGGIFTVKMTGPEALVNAERGRFLEFCQTLKPIE